jgi:hypothetical protein
MAIKPRGIAMNRFRSIVVAVMCAICVVVHAQGGLTGKWEGKTESGRPVLLDVRIKGKQLTGTFTLAQQSADIIEGKIEGKTFAFKASAEGRRTLAFNGRLVGDEIELTVEGVSNPLTLKRVK